MVTKANEKVFWKSKTFWIGVAEVLFGAVLLFIDTPYKLAAIPLIGLGLTSIGLRDAVQVTNLFKVTK